MISGRKSWGIILGVVVTHDLLADENQLLSCVCDEWVLSHPVLTRVVIASLALHLANGVPDRFDPVHLGFIALRKGRWWREGQLRTPTLAR